MGDSNITACCMFLFAKSGHPTAMVDLIGKKGIPRFPGFTLSNNASLILFIFF